MPSRTRPPARPPPFAKPVAQLRVNIRGSASVRIGAPAGSTISGPWSSRTSSIAASEYNPRRSQSILSFRPFGRGAPRNSRSNQLSRVFVLPSAGALKLTEYRTTFPWSSSSSCRSAMASGTLNAPVRIPPSRAAACIRLMRALGSLTSARDVRRWTSTPIFARNRSASFLRNASQCSMTSVSCVDTVASR